MVVFVTMPCLVIATDFLGVGKGRVFIMGQE